MKHLLPLKYVDAVEKAGSIRKAAELLSITSSALNRRILAMEDELGVDIFERLPRGVRHLLDTSLQEASIKLKPAIVSDSFEFLRNNAIDRDIIAFEIEIGQPELQAQPHTIVRKLGNNDVAGGLLYVGQLRGRVLPVAVANFANQVNEALVLRYEDN